MGGPTVRPLCLVELSMCTTVCHVYKAEELLWEQNISGAPSSKGAVLSGGE